MMESKHLSISEVREETKMNQSGLRGRLVLLITCLNTQNAHDYLIVGVSLNRVHIEHEITGSGDIKDMLDLPTLQTHNLIWNNFRDACTRLVFSS